MARDPALGAGEPAPLGVTLTPSGANVAVWSRHASAIYLCLFDDADREVARHRLPERTGDIHHGHVATLRAGQRYGLRAEGPFRPDEGHRFNAHKLLVDPYAWHLDRPFQLHPSMFGYRANHPDGDLSFDDADSAPFMPKAVLIEPQPLTPRAPLTPWPETILYELHVRGFTRRHPALPEALRGTLAGIASTEPLRHLVELGVTTIEMMPLAAWIDERHLTSLNLSNYWGYNPVAFGALDPRLAPGGWSELVAATAALAAAGLESVVDVVFNHSGEGDELGPTLSLRGLDNAGYYRLDPHQPRRYRNDAGCGNTLALERPQGLALVMEALRRLSLHGGVHGFRFDLATTLARRAEGFDPDHPLLLAIQQDPHLARLKLIVEPWDIGLGGYQLGAYPAPWGEWNDRFRDDIRRFWRGDRGMVGAMATRLAGSADSFGAHRPRSRSINFITAHDGFTLADLVSHERKQNAANGEDNRDGTDANHSWNHGVEGASDDPAILAARRRDMKALLATLLLSRGTPMLSMGDEGGRSQRGNNNAYAQDNATSWMDWAGLDADLTAHARELIALRRRHPALRGDRGLTGEPDAAGDPPDVAWLRADGSAMQREDWEDGERRLLIAVFTEADDRVLITLNAGWEDAALTPPPARPGCQWREADGGEPAAALIAAARSVTVLVEHETAPGMRRSAAADDALIDRLALAAGIEPHWWEVSGAGHCVSRDTKLALLAAMGLPAGTAGDARTALAALAALQRAPLPPVTVTRGGPTRLSLAQSQGRRVWLSLTDESGHTHRVAIAPGEGHPVGEIACDGHVTTRRQVRLPALPLGRYTLRGDGDDAPATLLVAPPTCHSPALLERRPFGAAGHLYSFRRTGDQGIGDFTALGEAARAVAAVGGVTLGLNPLHAMFPDRRDRASPYQPSDRRAIDPISLDVAALPWSEAPSVRAALAANEGLLAAARAARMVDYPAVWAVKRAVLEAAFALFEAEGDSPYQAAFAAFLGDAEPWLETFALHQAIRDRRGAAWPSWPVEWRDPAKALAARDGEASAMRFVLFQQWLCEQQLAAAAAHSGLPLGFYRDLAVGAAPDGSEAWAGQGHLAQGVSIGAPPDPFAAAGQVWGLPAPIPHRIRADGHRALDGLLAANMRHAGALRIDHAMGLQRLFWVPEGASGREGAYVGYPFDEQMAVLALNSARAGCLVIAEDLGTVPVGFRERLSQERILAYRVALLERDGAHFRTPAQFPHEAAASLGTHDLPTLAGWWRGADIDEMATLGLIAPEEAAQQHTTRAGEKVALADMAGLDAAIMTDDAVGGGPSPALVAGVHGALAASPCALMLVQIDDLADEPVRLNLPGTDRERPNWRRRLPAPIPELLTSPAAQSALMAIRARRGGEDPQGGPA